MPYGVMEFDLIQGNGSPAGTGHPNQVLLTIKIQIQIQKYLFRFKATGPLQAEVLN